MPPRTQKHDCAEVEARAEFACENRGAQEIKSEIEVTEIEEATQWTKLRCDGCFERLIRCTGDAIRSTILAKKAWQAQPQQDRRQKKKGSLETA